MGAPTGGMRFVIGGALFEGIETGTEGGLTVKLLISLTRGLILSGIYSRGVFCIPGLMMKNGAIF